MSMEINTVVLEQPVLEHNAHNARKRGFTLTEIAIVLGIIGLILGAIWVAAAAVYSNQRTSRASTAVLQTAQGIRSLYATSNTTGYAAQTLVTPTMISAGVIPADLTAGIGPFPNGTFGVSATGDGLGFVVTVTNVPQANCIALETQLGGAGRDSGLFQAINVITAAPAAGDAPAVTPAPLAAAITPLAASQGVNANAGGCTAALSPGKLSFGFTLK